MYRVPTSSFRLNSGYHGLAGDCRNDPRTGKPPPNSATPRGNVSACRRLQSIINSAETSCHYSSVKKQSYFPIRPYAHTPIRQHVDTLPQPMTPF